mmetsp:Transcript_9556/g.11806  ORF Transcript_9556/g.11806 Transcript_9556/m.11806 type:complete len:265 (-) Transcript_9556:422-1216(-)
MSLQIVDDVVFYFAYGSNMNEQRMLHRLPMIKGSRFAVLQDYELQFHSYSSDWKSLKGYCTITPKEGSSVEGLLYELPAKNLDLLDSYEGVPWSYNRKNITVSLQGTSIPSVTYIAEHCSPNLMPSLDYLFHVLQNTGFSPNYYQKLINVRTLEEMDEKIPVFIPAKQCTQISTLFPDLMRSDVCFVRYLDSTGDNGFVFKVSRRHLEALDAFYFDNTVSRMRSLSIVHETDLRDLEDTVGHFMRSNGKFMELFACWDYRRPSS